MPDPSVLINTIPLLEAQASSEIENIVTTADDLFRSAMLDDDSTDPAVKETLRYRTALRSGFESMKARALTVATAKDVCSRIKGIDMGVRALPGTRIVSPSTRKVIYSPPEGRDLILEKLAAWESFIHSYEDIDPLVRMALAHYQFEAIHPFSDGNGRTGRILNILVLVEAGLLQMPVLYLSRYIIDHKADYYRLLSEVTANAAWEDWTLFMLEAVRVSAVGGLEKIDAITALTADFEQEALGVTRGARHAGFVPLLFSQPYTRIGDVMERCGVSRPTAAGWLRELVDAGMFAEVKAGRDRLFLNVRFLELLTQRPV